MSITEELRKFIEDKAWMANNYAKALAIADRIDAEHQKACDDAWDNGYEADYLGIEKWLTEHPQVMEHHGWVRLPKDADGEVWHIGDRTESGQTIEAMGLNKYGWHFVGTVNEIAPAIHRHHHAPTVEDVLMDLLGEWSDEGNDATPTELAEKYAKRLTLADGEDA